MASFVLSTLNHDHNFTTTGMISLNGLKSPSRTQWAYQLPFFFTMAALAGLLGSFFNILHSWLAKLRAPKSNSTAR